MRIGIVGGGITGLALTHALASRGIDSVVFESHDRPGGLIESRRVEGRVLDFGPQRTRLVPPIQRLVEELGLEDRLVRARSGARLFIWTRGELRPVPRRLSELWRSDVLTRGGRLRLAAEPLTRGLRSGESVRDYFRRKAGDEAYRTLFGPLVSATFAADPARMPARHALPMLLRPLGVRRSLLAAARRRSRKPAPPACTFRDGLAELPRRLADRHAERIRLGTVVRSIRRAGDALELVCAGRGVEGREEMTDGPFDRVVLTVPAAVAATLLSELSTSASAILARLDASRLAVVHLDVESTPNGFGFQTAFGSPWRTRGVTWSSSLFGRRRLAVAYLGGGLDPSLTEWSDEDIGGLAAEEFEAIHGTSARVLRVGRAELPSYGSAWEGLGSLALPEGVILAATYRGRLGISARVAEAEDLADRLAQGGLRGGR